MPKHVAGQLKEIVYAQFEQGEDLLDGITCSNRRNLDDAL
jgi:hypothetical protein